MMTGKSFSVMEPPMQDFPDLIKYDCDICLQKIADKSTAKIFSLCGHRFHAEHASGF
jgi:hypothetical protein